MKNLLVLLCILTLSLFSCVTYKFTPIADESIKLQRNRGTVTPIYQDINMVLAITPKYVKEDIALQITISNVSPGLISLSDKDFTIYSSKDKLKWTKIETYTSEQYYKKENDAYTAGLVLMAISAGLNSYNAGRSTSSTTGSFNGNTSSGSYSGTYNSTTSHYDPAAAELARQRDQQNIQNYANSGKSWLDFLQNNLFYSVDLQSQRDYSGLIFAKNSENKYYKIIANTSIGTVTFLFLREKEQ